MISKRFDTNDPRYGMEQAGCLFVDERLALPATVAFSMLVDAAEDYSMGWYGLGNALYGQAFQTQGTSLLELACAACKRSLNIDPSNQFAKELMTCLVERTPLTQELTDAVPPCTQRGEDIMGLVNSSPLVFAEGYKSIDRWQRRMQVVMWLGGVQHELTDELLIAAVADPNDSVKRAAMKRIGAWGHRTDLRKNLTALAESDTRADLEPYLGMAVRRIATKDPENGFWAQDLAKRLWGEGFKRHREE